MSPNKAPQTICKVRAKKESPYVITSWFLGERDKTLQLAGQLRLREPEWLRLQAILALGQVKEPDADICVQFEGGTDE